PLGQENQAFGLRVGQRSQQDRVDHREDRGVGADPERERRDRHDRESRRAAQRPCREANVARELFHGPSGPPCGLVLEFMTSGSAQGFETGGRGARRSRIGTPRTRAMPPLPRRPPAAVLASTCLAAPAGSQPVTRSDYARALGLSERYEYATLGVAEAASW